MKTIDINDRRVKSLLSKSAPRPSYLKHAPLISLRDELDLLREDYLVIALAIDTVRKTRNPDLCCVEGARPLNNPADLWLVLPYERSDDHVFATFGS